MGPPYWLAPSGCQRIFINIRGHYGIRKNIYIHPWFKYIIGLTRCKLTELKASVLTMAMCGLWLSDILLMVFIVIVSNLFRHKILLCTFLFICSFTHWCPLHASRCLSMSIVFCSLIFAPIESAYMTTYWPSIVTLVLSSPVQRYYNFCMPKVTFSIHHPLFHPKFWCISLE